MNTKITKTVNMQQGYDPGHPRGSQTVKLKAIFQNESAEAIFDNDLEIGEDGWAMLAPFGDFKGMAFINGKKVEAIQRITRESMERMVEVFNSRTKKLKRKFLGGVNIFKGHPDHPGAEGEDDTVQGMILDLEVRDDGLHALPAFNNEGNAFLDVKGGRAFSGRWFAPEDFDATVDGMRVFTPEKLISVGLTNHPNLPVEMLNQQTKETTMTKQEILEMLLGGGVKIANADNPSDEDVKTAFQNAMDTLRGATEKEEEAAKTANAHEGEIKKKDEEVAVANAKVTELETKAVANKKATDITLANSQEALRTRCIDHAVETGRITPAEVDGWKTQLTADFVNSSKALGKLKSKLKVVSGIDVRTADRRVTIANVAERREKYTELVNKEIDNGMSYQNAVAAAKRKNPAFFESMEKEVAA